MCMKCGLEFILYLVWLFAHTFPKPPSFPGCCKSSENWSVAVFWLLLLCSFCCWLWYLCDRGAGADWNRWLFLGRGCSLSLNSYWAYTGFRWVLKVQWGCTVGHKVLFLLLEISFERIYTVPIRCKHCVTSWWEVMLYLCLCFTFWRLTPLKDVCSFCLLCFFSGFCGFL